MLRPKQNSCRVCLLFFFCFFFDSNSRFATKSVLAFGPPVDRVPLSPRWSSGWKNDSGRFFRNQICLRGLQGEKLKLKLWLVVTVENYLFFFVGSEAWHENFKTAFLQPESKLRLSEFGRQSTKIRESCTPTDARFKSPQQMNFHWDTWYEVAWSTTPRCPPLLKKSPLQQKEMECN